MLRDRFLGTLPDHSFRFGHAAHKIAVGKFSSFDYRGERKQHRHVQPRARCRRCRHCEVRPLNGDTEDSSVDLKVDVSHAGGALSSSDDSGHREWASPERMDWQRDRRAFPSASET
jgi:hypothetical protein